MKHPFFSVIIPSYNSENTIRRALISVLNQTETDYEIILVDDGSIDDTVEIVKKELADRSFAWTILTGNNQGAAGARNKGAQAAQGEFLAFLDSDDEWHPEKLSIQRKCLQDNQLDFIAAGYTLEPFSPIQSEIRIRFYTFKDLIWRNRFSTPGVVIKKDFFWSVGGFESYQRYAEDYTLWMKLAVIKALPAIISSPLVRLHKPAFGSAGLSANSWKMTLGEISGYNYLYQKKNISFFRFILALIISLLKYLRRKIILFFRNLKK